MYKNFNDYEILYMIGESNDFDILYQKYQPLIYKIVKDYRNLFKNYGYELDDLMQIGYITLYKASYLYNSYNNSLFYTYFIAALKRAISSEVRLNETNKRKCLNDSFSYNNLIPNTNTSYIELISDKEKDDYNEEKRKFICFKNSLSFLNACIFEMLYNGFSINEIMLLLNEGKQTIINGINDIKKQKKIQSY